MANCGCIVGKVVIPESYNNLLDRPTYNGQVLEGDVSSIITQNLARQTSVTLTAGDWSGGSQTVSVSGVSDDKAIVVAPAPTSISDYTDNGIVCTAQGDGTLTFTSDSTPNVDITVNVLIIPVETVQAAVVGTAIVGTDYVGG